MRKVYISEPIHEDAIRLLERSFEVVQGGGAADIAGRAYGCEAILVRVARITEEIMDAWIILMYRQLQRVAYWWSMRRQQIYMPLQSIQRRL